MGTDGFGVIRLRADGAKSRRIISILGLACGELLQRVGLRFSPSQVADGGLRVWDSGEASRLGAILQAFDTATRSRQWNLTLGCLVGDVVSHGVIIPAGLSFERTWE